MYEHTTKDDRTMKVASVDVRRVIVLDPGLTTGHVDDNYGKGMPANDTKVTDIRLDARGVLHGIIRFAMRSDMNASCNEQFELSFTDNHFNIVGGGWEIFPTEQETVMLLKAMPQIRKYIPHVDRPAAQSVSKE